MAESLEMLEKNLMNPFFLKHKFGTNKAFKRSIQRFASSRSFMKSKYFGHKTRRRSPYVEKT